MGRAKYKRQSGGHAARGEKRSATYHSWNGMMQRCYNPNHRGFDNYGGRGIRVCARWHTFANFLADMGVRPRDKTLDRREKNGHYCGSNCRWATILQQSRNQLIWNQYMGIREPDTVCCCEHDAENCPMHPGMAGSAAELPADGDYVRMAADNLPF